ncbi:MAG: hypothetical protein GY699_26200 [Desulfobacteraceae bacterium]|nr:hypothetical protein [Desulfobacteraceae bacterium]
MVSNISSTSNLINMISFSYQQSATGSQGQQGAGGIGGQPPPPPPTGAGNSSVDPLGVFDTVDSDSDGSISESEYNTLNEGILKVTGSVLASSFLDFDTDGDGKLNGSELRSVLDEAGFAPPPPPQQVISAYEAQNGEDSTYQLDDETLLAQLLEYLESRSGDLDVTI